jgi:large subunit ribosomal protein L19
MDDKKEKVEIQAEAPAEKAEAPAEKAEAEAPAEKAEAEAPAEKAEAETEGSKSLSFDEFRPGDNITVNIKIVEGERQRIQSFQGDVIKGRYIKDSPPVITSTFMVRRIASGVGVERIFPYFSPVIDSIKLNRRGKVNQARIYYMRERSGKSARIKERRI